jgi:hypothetical protein
MSFNAVTNALTVNPALSDIGTFTLDFTVKTVYDGMAPSQSATNSKVLTILHPCSAAIIDNKG